MQKASGRSRVLKGHSPEAGGYSFALWLDPTYDHKKTQERQPEEIRSPGQMAEEWQWEAARSMGGKVGTKGQQQHRPRAIKTALRA